MIRISGRKPRPKLIAVAALAIAVLLGTAACTSSSPTSTAQDTTQKVTDTYMQAAIAAVPYPLAAMDSGGWLERTLLKENLLRQNNAHRRAFVTLMNTLGQPIIQFPIQGMVFDLNSQMTTTSIVTQVDCGSNCGYSNTVPAAGDNGTWGPEPAAISFFTTSGMQVKVPNMVWWIETDAPLTMPNKPVLTYDPSAHPAITGGIVSGSGIAAGGTVARSK
jgi:hypothetical protein